MQTGDKEDLASAFCRWTDPGDQPGGAVNCQGNGVYVFSCSVMSDFLPPPPWTVAC